MQYDAAIIGADGVYLIGEAAGLHQRWFMYTPWVRSLIMRSGIESIRVRRSKED